MAHASRTSFMPLQKEFLEILVCPECKQKVHLNPTEDALICEQCRLAYEIREKIPVMVSDKARPLAD
jgi:uncharacterized protein YbaR (Trm112 family)